MVKTIQIEKAELHQLIDWLKQIEDVVESIKKEPEDPDDVVRQCGYILRTLEKIWDLITLLRY
jgi:hypothetical protein